jgi:hypothetical protein
MANMTRSATRDYALIKARRLKPDSDSPNPAASIPCLNKRFEFRRYAGSVDWWRMDTLADKWPKYVGSPHYLPGYARAYAAKNGIRFS